jgi:hypothetical protein
VKYIQRKTGMGEAAAAAKQSKAKQSKAKQSGKVRSNIPTF